MSKRFLLLSLVCFFYSTLYSQTSKIIKAPAGIQRFGKTITLLKNGNFVVTSGSSAGSVSLYNGQTLQLISNLTGSTASDKIGSDGIIPLRNGNFLVLSPYWDNGAIVDAGAVTFVNGTSGLSGTVNSSNSLVGSSANDLLGLTGAIFTIPTYGGVLELTKGNAVLFNPNWDNGAIADAGSVTWINETTGISGVISSTNSLIGTHTSDQVGGGFTNGFNALALSNGNYIVNSYMWDNGSATGAGAITFGKGNVGISGEVGISNSLVGTTTNDHVGSNVTEVGNSNFVCGSYTWDNGSIVDAGAATWVNGTTGISGTVTASNSLIGSSAGDNIGNRLEKLTNGNYVLWNSNWNNGSVKDAGAVTWADGNAGITGTISSSNSFVGSQTNDRIPTGVVALKNGDYILYAYNWSDGSTPQVGLVSKGSGTKGLVGIAGKSNSLIGSHASDYIGVVTELPNGNLIISSPYWDKSNFQNEYGIVMLFNKDSSIVGVVNAGMGLTGNSSNDQIGFNIQTLPNSNFIVQSYNYTNGTAQAAGSVTLVNGNIGLKGIVNASNSLLGSSYKDHIGYIEAYSGGFGLPQITVLKNSNFVVPSPGWDNGSIVDAGAITWVNGTTGLTGTISSSNSLIGSSKNDWVGTYDSNNRYAGVFELENGNYIIQNPYWNNGTITNAGAITFANGTSSITGTITSANSLIGANTMDQLGLTAPTLLKNGNFVICSPDWDNGSTINTGAVTWGSGTAGLTGSINQSNALVGTNKNERLGLGGITALTNGNYVIRHSFWNYNASTISAGAVIWGNGNTGITGLISSKNALIDSFYNSRLGYEGIYALPHGNYLVKSEQYFGLYSAVSMSCGGAPILGILDSNNSVLSKAFNSYAGTSNTFITPYYDTINNQLLVGLQGNEDNLVKVLKCDASVAIKTIHKPEGITMSIYPNPSNGNFQIVSENTIEKLEIFDMKGQRVYQNEPNEKKLEIHLTKPGIYIVKMMAKQMVCAQKTIIAQ